MSRAQDVRAAVWSVDKDQPVWKIRTLESLIERSIGPRRFVMGLLGGFSALAMLLAAIGIYGSMSYMVSQRTKEIGVRMALGASRRDVLSIVGRRAMMLTGCGIAAGAAIAVAVTQVITTFLFGVNATDPVTFFSVAGVLAVVAVAACYLPARTAIRVDPMVALRCE
jgi:ABC-type antimicrobial peptide transport system permease subunit